MTRIILLDIDGVLVQPHGYRAALRATVQRFIGNFHIKEDLLTEFERRGISSEWDMSPLIVAACWDTVLAHQPMEDLPDDVAMAAQRIKSRCGVVPKEIQVPEFDLAVGQYPAETAFRLGYFSRIPEGLRRNLLLDTRNVQKSMTMRTFQHFTLGSRRFEETYQLSAEFAAESFLLKYDRSNLDDKTRSWFLQNGNYLAAFSARPSHPPREITASAIGYAPEAELALELVGLQEIPLIAFGKLEYIAAQHGLDPAELVKPSPFQALAAAFAAWTGEELSSLHAVYDYQTKGVLNGRFAALPGSFELIVVEDTMGGIRSVRKAGEILRQCGLNVSVHLFGLTNGNKAKALAFEAANVPYYKEWETLIKQMIL